jgi:predicted acylesterase/phospholipase RssA
MENNTNSIILNQYNNIGISIGGGGANGGFGVKLLQLLREVSGLDFKKVKYVSGVSVGSLIGAFIAQEDEQILFDLFFTIKNHQVYNNKVNLFNLLKAVVLGKNHISDISPLFDLLSKYISLDKAQKSGKIFHIGTVDLDKGEYKSITQFDVKTNEDYIKLLVASCSQPAIWQTQTVRLKDNIIKHACDGGVLRVSPIGDLLNYNPEFMIIINNSPNKSQIIDDNKLDKSVTNVITRVIDLAITNAFFNDIKQFISYNNLLQNVKDLIGQELVNKLQKKIYKYILFDYNTHTDSMDFEGIDVINKRILEAEKQHGIFIANINTNI